MSSKRITDASADVETLVAQLRGVEAAIAAKMESAASHTQKLAELNWIKSNDLSLIKQLQGKSAERRKEMELERGTLNDAVTSKKKAAKAYIATTRRCTKTIASQLAEIVNLYDRSTQVADDASCATTMADDHRTLAEQHDELAEWLSGAEEHCRNLEACNVYCAEHLDAALAAASSAVSEGEGEGEGTGEDSTAMEVSKPPSPQHDVQDQLQGLF